jgi:hypothetical protein
MQPADQDVVAALAVEEAADRAEQVRDQQIVAVVALDEIVGDDGDLGAAMAVGRQLVVQPRGVGMRVEL